MRSNIALASMRRFSRLGFVRQRALAAESETLMRDLNLRPLAIERPIGQFSGGNQQKAIIGRWIAAGARILLFDEPTRGIDVGAKAEIYALIERLAAEGRSMIVVSSELPEILRVADRVLVMREGRIAGVLERDGLSEEAIVAPRRAAIVTVRNVILRLEVLSHVHVHTNGIAAAAAPSRRRFGLNVGLRDAGTLFGLLAIVVVFAVLSPNFLTKRQPPQHPAAVLDQRLRGAGHDARHHRRRHRSVGRPDGRHRRGGRGGADGGRSADRGGDPGSPALRRGGRRGERRARRLWRPAALHRDARHLVALPRHRP